MNKVVNATKSYQNAISHINHLVFFDLEEQPFFMVLQLLIIETGRLITCSSYMSTKLKISEDRPSVKVLFQSRF